MHPGSTKKRENINTPILNAEDNTDDDVCAKIAMVTKTAMMVRTTTVTMMITMINMMTTLIITRKRQRKNRVNTGGNIDNILMNILILQ